MQRQRYEAESLGPIIRGIEKRQKKLKALRPLIAKNDRTELDLRMHALEKSRQILSNACKTAPKMSTFFAGPAER